MFCLVFRARRESVFCFVWRNVAIRANIDRLWSEESTFINNGLNNRPICPPFTTIADGNGGLADDVSSWMSFIVTIVLLDLVAVRKRLETLARVHALAPPAH